MSVLKANRKESRFIVFRNIYKMRRIINDELLFDFGYRRDKAEAKVLHKMGMDGHSYEDLSEEQKAHFDKLRIKHDAYEQWFLTEMKTEILQNMRDITREIFMANSIYPTMREEMVERRIHQDRAIGYCAQLEQNLFTVIMELPVDHNRYTRIAKEIEYEIYLIKQWRKSDVRFRKMIENGDIAMEKIPNGSVEYPSLSESVSVLSEDPLAKPGEELTAILDPTNYPEIEQPQQMIKGMPERTFVRSNG